MLDLLRHGTRLLYELGEAGICELHDLPDDLDTDHTWLGETYGASTPEGQEALAWGAAHGLELEPVYTAKALAAVRALSLEGPVLYLQTHGPR